MGELGICDKKQYEHAGPHERITDSGGMMPPFGCLNWKPVAQPESQPPQDGPIWRVGHKVPLNVYEGDRPVCQCHTPEDATRIVAAMRAEAALTQVRDALEKFPAYPDKCAHGEETWYCDACNFTHQQLIGEWMQLRRAALAATQPGKEGWK